MDLSRLFSRSELDISRAQSLQGPSVKYLEALSPLSNESTRSLRCVPMRAAAHNQSVRSMHDSLYGVGKSSYRCMTAPDLLLDAILDLDLDDDEKENAISALIQHGKKSSGTEVAVLGERGIDDDLESIGSSLILEEEPEYKKRPSTAQSCCIFPELLDDSDGEVKYYGDLGLIEDKTWLPRHFQGHKVRKTQLVQKGEYRYYCNNKCPSSAPVGSYTELLKCFSHSRYARRRQSSNEMEVMCRFCRGENWVPKHEMNTHLALSHGVLKPPRLKPELLPCPAAMFEIKQRKMINKSVQCPECSKWIRLGRLPDGPPVSQSQGVYFNYFVHFVKNHTDV